jgi:hypothetical protein
MSLLADLRSLTVRSDAPCPLGELFERLTDEEAAILRPHLTKAKPGDPRPLGAARLHRILNANGHMMTRDAIAQHKRGECSCGPR